MNIVNSKLTFFTLATAISVVNAVSGKFNILKLNTI